MIAPTHFLAAALVAAAMVFPALPTQAIASPADTQAAQATTKARPSGAASGTVYSNQPDFTEKELLDFIRLLPDFRAWVRASGEEAHPVLTARKKPDFLYSQAAAAWIQARGWEPRRFFCIMGRSAAALILVSEGSKVASRYKDMPMVSKKECELVREHLGELLKAGNAAAAKQQ